jgi:hypothetical protein
VAVAAAQPNADKTVELLAIKPATEVPEELILF